MLSVSSAFFYICEKFIDFNPRYKIVQDSLKQANLLVAWADKQYQHLN